MTISILNKSSVNKLITLTMMVCAHLHVSAALVTEDVARQVAFDFLCSQQKASKVRSMRAPVMAEQLELAYVGKSCYVFNATEGFAIVSAYGGSDAVLGYSPDGIFDANNLPAGIAEWLDAYESAELSLSAEAAAHHAAIEPMTTTKWGQHAPYNLLIVNNYATGCVATAMAQLMAYHKWPIGESKEVGDLPPTTFDWELINDTYEVDDTGASAQEVAKLMKYCGVSVNTKYYGAPSTAYFQETAEALKCYFGYAESVRDVHRVSYTTEEWDNLIYNELANGRPVLYSALGTAGHAMVCDGYDGNGYYHINWGWSGSGNGFYRLPSLNGYSLSQAAIIGVEKATEPYDYRHKLEVYLLDRYYNTYRYVRPASGTFVVEPVIGWEPFNQRTYDFTVAGGLYKDHKLVKVLPVTWSHRMSDTPMFKYRMSIDQTVANGHYQLRMLYREEGDTAWVEPLYSDGEFYDIVVRSDSLFKTMCTWLYKSCIGADVLDMRVEGNLQCNSPQKVFITVCNNGTARVGRLITEASTGGDIAFQGAVGYGIDPGETDVVMFEFTPMLDKDYKITIKSDYQTVLAEQTVAISDKSLGVEAVSYREHIRSVDIWTADGRKANGQGLNIIRYSDGTVRKVITK